MDFNSRKQSVGLLNGVFISVIDSTLLYYT